MSGAPKGLAASPPAGGGSRIAVMPPDLVNKIAAGEVVERPSSVVKELMENSLDAGARRIQIQVTDGGIGLIEVSDDGIGMSEEDAVLAFERHATSKLRTVEDLFNITTLGFRGEAIPSIASVSRMELVTRLRGANSGTRVVCEGGAVLKVEPAGHPEGTTVRVRDLFFNTPARLKYLKAAATETRHIIDTASREAVGRPDVSVKLTVDGREVLATAGTGSPLECIARVMGSKVARGMVQGTAKSEKLRVIAYLARPSLARGDRFYQYLFINSRPVRSQTVKAAVDRAYGSTIPPGKNPVWVVYIDVDPREVDVNVHPTKAEVRFGDDQEVFRLVLRAAVSALRSAGAIEDVDIPESSVLAARPFFRTMDGAKVSGGLEEASSDGGALAPGLADTAGGRSGSTAGPGDRRADTPYPPAGSQGFSAHAATLSAESLRLPPAGGVQFAGEAAGRGMALELASDKDSLIGTAQYGSLRYVGQVGGLYIVLESEDGILIVDQHAAHERVLYEEILAAMQTRSSASQGLLIPVTVEVGPAGVEAVLANLSILASAGFSLEPFGGGTVLVRAIPAALVGADVEAALNEALSALAEEASAGPGGKRESLARTLACRSAIKQGDGISPKEACELVRKVFSCSVPYACPHGRPLVIRLGYADLERAFHRR